MPMLQVAKKAGEARPPGIAMHSARTESESDLAESSDEESSDPGCARPSGTTSAIVTAAAKSVGEDRPPEIAKCSATQSAVPRPVPTNEILELLGTPRELIVVCSGHDRELS